jgi:hypothetical protein
MHACRQQSTELSKLGIVKCFQLELSLITVGYVSKTYVIVTVLKPDIPNKNPDAYNSSCNATRNLIIGYSQFVSEIHVLLVSVWERTHAK